MKMNSKKSILLCGALILIAGLLPIVIYCSTIGSAPNVTPERARELLATGQYVLVDIRDKREYDDAHLKGAAHWPLDAISGVHSSKDIPAEFSGKRLLLICTSGLRSARATNMLNESTHVGALSVRGGMNAWYYVTVDASHKDLDYHSLINKCGTMEPFPFKESTMLEQIVVCACAFGIKPAYMLASLFLIVLVRRRRENDMRALMWALIFFLAGELFCAINYLFCADDSYLMEYLHIYGMVLSFGFTAYAFMEALDARILHFTDPEKKCAFLALCTGCHKYDESTPCRLRQVFQIIVLFLIILTTIPLLSAFRTISYNTDIFGTFYNYTHQSLYQIYEIRFAPIMALLFFVIAGIVISIWKEKSFAVGKMLVSAGIGFFGMSMFRLVLLALFDKNLAWFVSWEEITEFMYIAGVGFLLWLFRRRIFSTEYAAKMAEP